MTHSAYETVIGLEVHVELNTRTKIFCSCPTEFGAEPNTQICPVCMGLPGALPVLNREVVRLAAKAGLSLSCTVDTVSGQDRKNYFYPDLPKAYQISQYDRPLCRSGALTIPTPEGEKVIGITRIHIEEDAGKLIHDPKAGTMIDYNRCGVPLIEIVSEPDLRSAEEAKSYLQKLRALLRYIGISDCRMNEGSFRADVNLSVRKKGDPILGTRTEIKNLNSFAFAAKAIEAESARQIALLESGQPILRETRRFDPDTGKTEAMRKKESAADYRFFPDPDLPPVHLSEAEIDAIRGSLPELPDRRRTRFCKDFGLSEYDASLLSSDRALADYFEEAANATAYPQYAANLILTELLRLSDAEDFSSPIASARIAALATLLGDGTISGATAKKLLPRLASADFDPALAVQEENLSQINDRETLLPLIRQILADNPRSVADYRAGKTRAVKSLVGQVMSKTSGRANPSVVNTLFEEELNK
ncbi:MAG: Asp-tRNA(Asn)/Glu-tRNA(Gln) amidotransferase subunit GatB [Clostridia bacterium]|nr:Asp-tRNA(Asn)/Glu-tRNA(Gln) amidotransferase subunit GatB [Clostridia bacterium]